MTWEGVESWDECFERQLREYREAVADHVNTKAVRQILFAQSGAVPSGFAAELSRLESLEHRARLAVVETFRARR